ncbi:MAG: hypothetical protein LBR80_15510 [Deltaproteobacteria bacterium]|jgi:hypothetical protein|nr:hypothetical protein [Deltaproteobacteria bacterium]
MTTEMESAVSEVDPAVTEQEHDAIMNLAPIIPGILQLLVENRNLTAEFAGMIVYNSKSCMMLEDKKWS